MCINIREAPARQQKKKQGGSAQQDRRGRHRGANCKSLLYVCYLVLNFLSNNVNDGSYRNNYLNIYIFLRQHVGINYYWQPEFLVPLIQHSL